MIREKELKEERLPDSAVILEEERETLIEWMLILKASGVEVYPEEGNLDAQTEKLLNYYDHIYYIHEDEGDFDIKEHTSLEYEPLYTNTFVHSEDMVNETGTWIGYPKGIFSEEKTFRCYIIKQ